MFQCDAILFDLDGVLVDSTAVVERQWEIWARARGYDAAKILSIAHGRRIQETLQLVAPEYATEDEAERLAQAEAADVEGLRVMPGAARLLEALPPDSWAVATSGTRMVATTRLTHAGLPLPRVLITADDVTSGKPSPEPYLRAAAALGVPPERCLVIEDAPAGIASAVAAGMQSVGVVGTFARTELARASVVTHSLENVRIEAVAGRDARLAVLVRDAAE